MPNSADALSESKPPVQNKKSSQSTSTQPSSSSEPKVRSTLIRNIDYGIEPTTQNRRALDIFSELKNKLKFSDHGNAIAVLLRVLLEISIDQYIAQLAVGNIQPNDKLSRKFVKCADHMLDNNHIDKDYHRILKKFENSEPVVSANTLHGYVHNHNYFPSDIHLKSIWDMLEKFVIICIKS